MGNPFNLFQVWKPIERGRENKSESPSPMHRVCSSKSFSIDPPHSLLLCRMSIKKYKLKKRLKAGNNSIETKNLIITWLIIKGNLLIARCSMGIISIIDNNSACSFVKGDKFYWIGLRLRRVLVLTTFLGCALLTEQQLLLEGVLLRLMKWRGEIFYRTSFVMNRGFLTDGLRRFFDSGFHQYLTTKWRHKILVCFQSPHCTF